MKWENCSAKTRQADISTTSVNVLNLQGDGGQPTLFLQFLSVPFS
jgi:hypothetical protein